MRKQALYCKRGVCGAPQDLGVKDWGICGVAGHIAHRLLDFAHRSTILAFLSSFYPNR